MSHPWRCLRADKHLGGSGSSSRGLAVVSHMGTIRTVILSDLSREWREASVDHCSHNAGRETQLGHRHVCTERFEQHIFPFSFLLLKGRHKYFWNEGDDSKHNFKDLVFPPEFYFCQCGKAFWNSNSLSLSASKISIESQNKKRLLVWNMKWYTI